MLVNALATYLREVRSHADGAQADFDKVTKFAHAVKKSLPPLKAAQM